MTKAERRAHQWRSYWQIISEARHAARRIGYSGDLVDLVLWALAGVR